MSLNKFDCSLKNRDRLNEWIFLSLGVIKNVKFIPAATKGVWGRVFISFPILVLIKSFCPSVSGFTENCNRLGIAAFENILIATEPPRVNWLTLAIHLR